MKPAPDPNKDCNCLIIAPQSLDFKELGMDKRYAEVSVSNCKNCGRHWLRYFYENEGFTASGRWYLGSLTSEQLSELSLENAKQTLENLDWYYCGGSYFSGRVSKASGKINL